jgi:ribosomal protein L6P/L9E
MGGFGSRLGSKIDDASVISDHVFVSYDVSLTKQDMIIIQGENKDKLQEMAIQIRELNKNSEFKECEITFDEQNKKWRQEFYFQRRKAKLPNVKIAHFSEF